MATTRITGSAKQTVVDFLEKAGEACAAFQDKTLVNLPCRVLQLDEIWSFVGCKEKSKKTAKGKHAGDIWTWTAIDAETKLIPSWRVGDRSARTAMDFCNDLADRMNENGEVQITTDGHTAYRMAVGNAFDLGRTHYAQLIKIYGKDENGMDIVTGIKREPVFGKPDLELCSTSYVERSNLTLRMGNRRFTRLTNGFSKKVANHCHHLAIHHMNYNFCRKHSTIKTTPAVAAGMADHRWTLEEVVEMIDRHHADIMNARFEAAFDAKFTPERTAPKTYAPVAPKLPWYLQGFPNSDEKGGTSEKP
ncbi:MAG: IS1 family transposase [Chthoniobacter sp.]|uniref:IS1 family transposase n=1 Tax=Chthoniobacter sp. TaxID=2510640 RepID=UPI0032A1C969